MTNTNPNASLFLQLLSTEFSRCFCVSAIAPDLSDEFVAHVQRQNMTPVDGWGSLAQIAKDSGFLPYIADVEHFTREHGLPSDADMTAMYGQPVEELLAWVTT